MRIWLAGVAGVMCWLASAESYWQSLAA